MSYGKYSPHSHIIVISTIHLILDFFYTTQELLTTAPWCFNTCMGNVGKPFSPASNLVRAYTGWFFFLYSFSNQVGIFFLPRGSETSYL